MKSMTHIYSAGFPCKAFSFLNLNSGLLLNKEAKQFYKVVEEIRRAQPPIWVLENVIGILRVKVQVLEKLQSVGAYYIYDCILDPLKLGCPVSRRRVYIIGIRRDVLRQRSSVALAQQAEDIMKAMLRAYSNVLRQT